MARHGRFSGYGRWAPYVSVGQKIALGKAAAKKLAQAEGRDPCPVAVEGRKIAKTFWGLKWCENLERYRDIANRLPRGETYVRNGSVADLMIEPGRVRAIVGGSEAYTVEIKINTLPPKAWNEISHDCAQEIESLFDLLQGKFSNGVMRRLTHPEEGLFPHKNEISMKCSCPDFAGVCKHIAATFYGVAVRLDRQPELLFRLRNVDHLQLIGQAADAASLDQALSVEGQTLTDSDLESIFGIELETSARRPSRPGKSSRPAASAKPKSAKARSKLQPVAPVGQDAAKTKAGPRTSRVRPPKGKTPVKEAEAAPVGSAAKSAMKSAPAKSSRKTVAPTFKLASRRARTRKSKKKSPKKAR